MAANPIEDNRQFTRRCLVHSDVTGIAAGQRCTGTIGTRKTLHAVYFETLTGAGVGLSEVQAAAEVLNIVIRANGVPIRDVMASEVLDLYQHYKNDMGLHTVNGIIPIEFADCRFDMSQMNAGYGMGMIGPDGKPVVLTYEITLAAAIPNLSRIRVRLVVDDREMPFALHKRILRHTRTFGAGPGTQDITDLPKGDGTSSLLAYHVILPAGSSIASITVKDGDIDVYNDLPSSLMDVLINDAGRKTQAGYFHIPFDLANDPRAKQLIGPQTANWLVQPNWLVGPNGNFTILEEREHVKL